MIRHIVVADDDTDDLAMFQEAVSEISEDILCQTVENGRDLLTNIAERSPQVIFLDVNMPEMNGWECLAVLKSDIRLNSIPVIMYSTSSAVGDAQKAINFGAFCFYEKPPSYALLKNFIETVVNSKTIDSNTIKSVLSKAQKVYFG